MNGEKCDDSTYSKYINFCEKSYFNKPKSCIQTKHKIKKITYVKLLIFNSPNIIKKTVDHRKVENKQEKEIFSPYLFPQNYSLFYLSKFGRR